MKGSGHSASATQLATPGHGLCFSTLCWPCGLRIACTGAAGSFHDVHTVNSLLQDLRFAIRQIRRSSSFAVNAVLLGIAANIIVFGVRRSVVLRPLDVPQSDRVMQLRPTNIQYPVFSYPEIREILKT